MHFVFSATKIMLFHTQARLKQQNIIISTKFNLSICLQDDKFCAKKTYICRQHLAKWIEFRTFVANFYKHNFK